MIVHILLFALVFLAGFLLCWFKQRAVVAAANKDKAKFMVALADIKKFFVAHVQELDKLADKIGPDIKVGFIDIVNKAKAILHL